MTDPKLDHQRRETIRRFFAAIEAGDHAVLQELLTPDAITRWPQSGERITGAMSCVHVYENYPGEPPAYAVHRISGGGATWVAELVADYSDGRWYTRQRYRVRGSADRADDRLLRTELPGPRVASRVGRARREHRLTRYAQLA
jgi:hypothetical protein